MTNLRCFKAEARQRIDSTQSICIAMADIDYFKQYNDTHGHPQRDKILRSMGQIFKDHIGEEDLVTRYGGEEFIFLFKGKTSAEGFKVADLIRAVVEGYPFIGRETQPGHKLTISVGLSCSIEGSGLSEMITKADKVLYESKRNGRNRCSLYSDISTP
jgi:diguanylate cyclase